MTLATLAIQAEAWVQEEIAAQRQVLDALARTESAARAGDGGAVERGGRELSALIALAGPRSARRRALLGKLAGELGLAPGDLRLSLLIDGLGGEHGSGQRLAGLRAELREIVSAALRTGRRLAALARYHRGLLEDVCRLVSATTDEAGREARWVDARA